MDRETWFNILQLAVVAPYIYTVSEKQSGYFKLGLKLVAGALVIRALPPLMKQVQPLVIAAQKMQQENDAASKAKIIEGEAETVV